MKLFPANDIKKGMKIRTTQLGAPLIGSMEDNKKGIIRLIYTHGEVVGMFDEYGSIYISDIVQVYSDEAADWIDVGYTEKQAKLLHAAGQRVDNARVIREEKAK